jgi:hypothetical protein
MKNALNRPPYFSGASRAGTSTASTSEGRIAIGTLTVGGKKLPHHRPSLLTTAS